MSSVHVVIGDTQVKPGVPTRHLQWIGRYIADQFWGRDDVKLVHLGDHYDMPSLSSYDKGKRAMEGRRYVDDVRAGNEGFDLLNEPLHRENRKRRKCWRPERHFLLGNHEDRITRATQADAQLEGKLSLSDLNVSDWEWKVHQFLEPVDLDGVFYSHYFYNPMSGRPYGGELAHRLKQIGHSFTMGHTQGMAYAVRPVGPTRHHGLVLGSTYLHDETYLGPQATSYWRGLVVKHQVENGTYDPMFVSLDYLCRRYEKQPLAQYLKRAA